ncbi:MAG: 4'-phosphopantetheinyl transferase superfamily protein [Pseudomonadota bacterium]
MELKFDEVHVWVCYPDRIQDPALIARYENLLSPEEKARKDRFLFAQHRHQYLVSRALVRGTLSHYASCSPDEWAFSTNEYGRPEIIRSKGLPPLRFNLSHTLGIAACAVVLRRDIGVDVEDMERKIGILQIANRYFSRPEIDSLHCLSEEKRRIRFFEYWTLKESYSKAKGVGLTLPLNRFTFHQPEGAEWRISFDPSIEDDAIRWQFRVSHPTPRHALAVSVNRPVIGDYHLTYRETVPLLK